MGRKIGFPTANLDVSSVPSSTKTGVYAAKLFLANPNENASQPPLIGALYYGPRLVMNETKNVLEVHILNFNQQLYSKTLWFSLSGYIRDVIHFKSLEEVTNQLTKDCKDVQEFFKHNSINH